MYVLWGKEGIIAVINQKQMLWQVLEKWDNGQNMIDFCNWIPLLILMNSRYKN